MIQMNFILDIRDNNENSSILCVSEQMDDKISINEAFHRVYKKYSIRSDYKYGWYVKDFQKTLWEQYFSSDIYENMLMKYREYLKVKIKDYEYQFNISKLVFHMVVDPGGMGAVYGRNNGVKYFFHTNERDKHKNTPHIHCEYNGEQCSVIVDTLEVICSKKFQKSKVTEIKKYVKKNREDIRNYYNNIVKKGEVIKLKTINSFDKEDSKNVAANSMGMDIMGM